MTKKSQRHQGRHERGQSGCMGGLISMFDFRHDQPTQKLIADSRHESKHLAGAGSPMYKVDSLHKSCQGTLDHEEITIAATDTIKPSVEKLIEEKMFDEQDTRKDICEVVESQECGSEHGGMKSKNQKRRSRSRTKSYDMHLEDPDVPGNLEPEQACLEKPEKQPQSDLDIAKIVEDFCNQIHQKSISRVRHDEQSELPDQLNQKNLDFQEKMGEAIKLISERLISRTQLTGHGEPYPSKELKDALQILSCDEEYKSIMVKKVHDLWKAQIENLEDGGSFVGSNLSERHRDGFRQSDKVIPSKQRKLFRRKAKAQGNDPSKGNESSQSSNRIVILKPGYACLQNPETESFAISSPECQFIAKNKGSNDRVSSLFFFAEIKRRLKHAMGKEKHGLPPKGNSKRFSNKHQAVGDCDKVCKENLGMSSPSKDHFFIEKIARPPTSAKRKEKTSKLKEGEISEQHESVDFPKKRLSNIYIEAKKHLSAILSGGPGDGDSSSRRDPKALGRILSLPEYNVSPIHSPGRDSEQSSVTAKLRLSTSDRLQRQEDNACPLDQTTLNVEPDQSSIADDHTDNTVQSPSKCCLSGSNDLPKRESEKPFGFIGDAMTSEGYVEVTEAIVHEDTDILDSLAEPTSPSITIDDQNDNIFEVFVDRENSNCFKADSLEENQTPPSSLTSPSTSSNKNVNDLEDAGEIRDRRSPVSVLELLFSEEDISPASTRYHSVEPPVVEPLRIQFEEHDASAADGGILFKTSTEDKESVFEYVKAVLQVSGMNWDALYMRAHSSDQLLDPAILVEVEFFCNQLCFEKRLLFDSINEVLMEVYGRYAGGFPQLSFKKSNIRPIPDMKSSIFEVWQGVYWHLLPHPLPHTLDQLVKKELSKTGTWMDLRHDAEAIVVEIGEDIFEDLMEEMLLDCSNESSEIGNPLIPADCDIDRSILLVNQELT